MSPLHLHFVGICGAGMQALVDYYLDRGAIITGSDGRADLNAVEVFAKSGIRVSVGHCASHIPSKCQQLIYSAAVPPENVERLEARQRGIPQKSYIEALAEISKLHHAIAIAGTHGKSSTTAMLAQILISAGHDPSVICGAESLTHARSGRGGRDSTLIFEACEYRQHFLKFDADILCVTGIEHDHFDCYESLKDVETAFSQLIQRLPVDGVLIVRGDCLTTATLVKNSGRHAVTFGIGSSGDWRANEIQYSDKTRFRLTNPHGESAQVELSVPGEHNVFNALAAAACASQLSVGLAEIAAGLKEYVGIRRRLEFKRTWLNAWVYDDYAHHPSEVAAAIQAVKSRHVEAKIVAVFQPHQLSRTRGLFQAFADALSQADSVYLLPIFAARETFGQDHVTVSQKLLQSVKSTSGWIPSLDQVWRTIQTDADENVVILTMGAGDLSRIHYEFTE